MEDSNQNVLLGTNIIQNSSITVGGSFSLINIDLHGEAIESLKELLDIIEKIKHEISIFDINQSSIVNKVQNQNTLNKKRYQTEIEINNYLIPRLKSIQTNKSTDTPHYIWTKKDNPKQRFWDIDLPSTEKNINNLDKLNILLKDSNFKQADSETSRLIIEEINFQSKSKKSYLSYKDIINIPIELIYEIDQLWLYHSEGRFGITPQYIIWKKEGGSFDRFGFKIGWKVQHDGWLDKHTDFKFNISAPLGHLPSLFSTVSVGANMANNWNRVYENLINKIDNFLTSNEI